MSLDEKQDFKPTPPTTLPVVMSPQFNDVNADVTFISSDNTLFKVFSKHLEVSSAGFPAPRNGTITSEPIQLVEPSEVLEVLFAFVQPPSKSLKFRQPSVVDMEINQFFQLAEAAEKYTVFTAAGTCITRMEQLYDEYPVQVLNHCIKHGYPELGDKAAYESLPIPLEDIAKGLTHPGLLSRWLTYSGYFARSLKDNLQVIFKEETQCPVYHRRRAEYIEQFIQDPRLVFSIPASYYPSLSCTGGRWCSCKDESSQGSFTCLRQHISQVKIIKLSDIPE